MGMSQCHSPKSRAENRAARMKARFNVTIFMNSPPVRCAGSPDREKPLTYGARRGWPPWAYIRAAARRVQAR